MPKTIILAAIILLITLPASADALPPPAMQTQLDAIAADVQSMRGLQIQSDVPLRFPSQQELTAYLMRRFEHGFPPEQLKSEALFLRALDLAPPDIDLRATLLDFWLNWIGGYYNFADDSVNLVLTADDAHADQLTIPQQVIYAHELVHALQDQQFDLEAIIDDATQSRSHDRRLATLALIEGDANVIMLDYLRMLWREDSTAVHSAYEKLPEQNTDRDIPPVISAAIEFPYRQGSLFVEEIISARGWSAINSALQDNPPTTTEHIYHPETYLRGEEALPVSMPDMQEAIGENWRLEYDGPVGLFYLRQHLLAARLNADHAHSMASGWGGDRMRIFADDSSGEIAWTIYQRWDSPQDAAQFAQGYRHLLNTSAPRAPNSNEAPCWIAKIARCFARPADSETRIASAPNKTIALRLLAIDG